MSTILVVDDDRLIRQMVALVLEHAGFNVLTAESGWDAIRVSHERPGEIDLLITDVRMPSMDGGTLAAELQSENPSLPVLLMSGYCDGEAEESCGRFPLLAKPFSIVSLLRHVQELLEKAAGRSQSANMAHVT